MRAICATNDAAWSRMDTVEDLKKDVERWKSRAIELSHNIEMACDALRAGEDVSFSDRRGTLVVTLKEPQS